MGIAPCTLPSCKRRHDRGASIAAISTLAMPQVDAENSVGRVSPLRRRAAARANGTPLCVQCVQRGMRGGSARHVYLREEKAAKRKQIQSM
jgi:hypothetical protein